MNSIQEIFESYWKEVTPDARAENVSKKNVEQIFYAGFTAGISHFIKEIPKGATEVVILIQAHLIYEELREAAEKLDGRQRAKTVNQRSS